MTRPALVLVLLAAAGVTAGVNLRARPAKGGKPALPDSPLHVPAGKLDFGTAWEDGQFAYSVPVENRGGTTVEVEDIRASCQCYDVAPKQFTLAPGQTQTVSFKLALRPAPGTPRAEAGYPFAAGLTPKIKGATTRFRDGEWVVRGTVKPWVTPEAAVVRFGRQSVKAQPLAPRTLTVRPLTPLGSLEAVCHSPHFTAAARPLDDIVDPTFRTAG
jgi:hypothetical protein